LLDSKKSELLNLGYGRGYSILEVVQTSRKIIKDFPFSIKIFYKILEIL